MKHFLNTQDWPLDDLQAVIDGGKSFRGIPVHPHLTGKSIALLFFNPSLRTRTSFEIGAFHLGAHAVVLQPGQDAWPLEFEMGVIMDDEAEEHVQEAASVLSRYCDLIAVRAFPKFMNWQEDRQDKILNAFATHSSVPVINMETITHPCQELAHIMALQDRLGDLKGRKYVLTWTWHPRPLNTAVANSALMIATRFGMDVTLLCPDEEFLLDERYLSNARKNALETEGAFQVSHDIESSYDGAEIVYAKSWGAIPYFGRWDEEKPKRDRYKHFIVDECKMAMTNEAIFSHCLPMRRNVKATDQVIDSQNSIVLEEAANRMHVQKAIMCDLLGVPMTTNTHTQKDLTHASST
ncbi:MAG: N-acetylornithine carbamoyltransferase [Planctomycetota bacterium]|nr:N-acetylornithine carbamoyltransferase [Planctomycetota bacterium]